MAKPPAFQFYAKDFISGTDTMTAAEVGIYIRLLCSSWDNGPLPTEPSRLAIVAKTQIGQFLKAWPVVKTKWVETPAGLVNDRLEAQRAELAAYAEMQAERGRRSGVARRAKHEPAFEPETNQRSNGGSRPVRTGDEPETNSSICNLQSADQEPHTEREALSVRARETTAPVWRPAGPRRADISQRDLDYHRRHCALWAVVACDAGLCIPKYLWPKWEKRYGVDVLRAFVETWVSRAKGDKPEDFWPEAFKQHFGAGLASGPIDKATQARSALDEALAINAARRKAVGDGVS